MTTKTISRSKIVKIPQAGLADIIDKMCANTESITLKEKYAKFYKACLQTLSEAKQPDGNIIILCHIPQSWYVWLKNEYELPI
jgi:hypothetical protein